jgi:hypothetical protein
VWLLNAWRSSVAMVGDVAAPSQMEQSADVCGRLLQLSIPGVSLPSI